MWRYQKKKKVHLIQAPMIASRKCFFTTLRYSTVMKWKMKKKADMLYSQQRIVRVYDLMCFNYQFSTVRDFIMTGNN